MNTGRFTTIMNRLDELWDSEKIVLICGEERLSYRQLAADAKQIARGLVKEGVKKGDRVLFCMRNTADAIRCLLGILYAGGVYVAADPDWPQERIGFIASDAKTVFSLTDETGPLLRGRQPQMGEEPDFVLSREADEITKSASEPNRQVETEVLEETGIGEKQEQPTQLPDVSGEDEAAIYYTSGSTGQPKGTVLSHAVMGTIYGTWELKVLESPEYENWETILPIFKIHFVPLLSSLCITFFGEKTLFLPTDAENRSIDLLAAAVEKNHPDLLAGTPSVVLRFLENPAFSRAFSAFRYVALGGEKLTSSVLGRITQMTKAKIIVPYGSTEMLYCSEYFYRSGGSVHVGDPGYGVYLYPMNESMEELSPGQEGELFIGGTGAVYGRYLNRPDLDAEKYVEHPRLGRLFRTGDLVRLEMDGELTVVGRKDGMVKLHGQRLEIAEIENAMGSFPGIRRAAVRLMGEAPNEMLAGYYTVSAEVSETELRRYLADRLPYYMVPSLFMRLEDMPENAHGKLDYRALPLIALPRHEYAPAETKREKWLCELFAEVLKREEPVGVNDSFLALGGDSISTMVVISRLRKRGLSFEVRWLFTAPTARLLAPLLVPVKDWGGEGEALKEPSPGQRRAIEAKVGWENVECVYPVTREVKARLDERDPYLTYSLVETGAFLEPPEQWRRRLEEMTQKHQALRSVFLCEEGEEHLQVVLREHQPDCFEVDLRSLSEGEGLSPRQKAYFRNLVQLDLGRPKDLEREVLFKAGRIRISQEKSILFLGASHLLLDGIGMERILAELMDMRLEILPDREDWQRHFVHLYRSDTREASAYFRKLLTGCGGFTALPARKEGEPQISPEFLYAAGGKKLYEQAMNYCSAHHFTFAALIHFVFGRMLMELLSTDDVCFLSIGSGRTAQEVELAGMLYVNFPVRLRRGDSLAACQMQLLNSSSHMGYWELCGQEITAGWEKCHAVLDIVSFFDDSKGAGRRITPFALSETPEQHRAFMNLFRPGTREDLGWRFMVETEEHIGFFCAGAYNAGRYDSGYMKELPQKFIRQLRQALREDL